MDKPQICYVAMIDIMGFENFVDSNDSTAILTYLRNFITVNSVFNSITPNMNVSVVSDTIAIAVPASDDPKTNTTRYLHLLRYVSAMQYQIFTAPNLGLPLRGAITKGEFYSNQKDILFGKAWNRAVWLEKNKVNFPRVVVDKDANDCNCMLIMPPPSRKNYREAPLRQDSDGELYCNYLSSILDHEEKPPKDPSFILSHKHSITKNLCATKDDNRLYEKYKWMRDYHNWFCSGYDELKDYLIAEEVSLF